MRSLDGEEFWLYSSSTYTVVSLLLEEKLRCKFQHLSSWVKLILLIDIIEIYGFSNHNT